MVSDIEVPYCTREAVQRMTNSADSPRRNQRVDEAILQASRDLEGLLHRRFYPWTGTRQFDVPDTDTLWLYDNELAEIISIQSGDSLMTTDDYVTGPVSGPPITYLDVRWGGSVGWEAGQDSWQRSISITGVYNHPVRVDRATELTDEIFEADATIQLDSSAQVGAGSLLLLGDERMLVTEKTWSVTDVELAGDLTASKGQTAVAVDDGSGLDVGELIMVNGERMFIEDVAGNTLIVTRGEPGSVLASHSSGTAIYAKRTARVARGILGTEAATHAVNTPIYLLRPPSLVVEAAQALAVTAVEQGSSGYARVIGSADNQREAGGRGVAALLERAYTRYGRKARGRAI